MLLIPIIIAFFQYPLFSAQNCKQFGPQLATYPVAYYCYGSAISDYYGYYSRINEMILVGGLAVFGTVTYAIHSRGRVLSGILLLFTSAVFPLLILSTQLPLEYALVSSLTATGGVLALSFDETTRVPVVQRFAGQIFSVLTRRVVVVVFLVVLIPGLVGSLWGYANETAASVWVTCETSYESVGFAHNETVGVTNPFFFPLHATWKITYDYTQGLVYSDTVSFYIPAHGSAYPHFAFASLDLQRGMVVNSTYPIIFTYALFYRTLLWSSFQTGSSTYTSGKDFGPGYHIRPC